MNEGLSFPDLKRFALELFDGQEEAVKAAGIMAGMWAARSVRIMHVDKVVSKTRKKMEPLFWPFHTS